MIHPSLLYLRSIPIQTVTNRFCRTNENSNNEKWKTKANENANTKARKTPFDRMQETKMMNLLTAAAAAATNDDGDDGKYKYKYKSTKGNGDDDNGGGGGGGGGDSDSDSDSDARDKKNQDNHDHFHLLEFGQRLEPLRRFYGDNVITITTKSTSSTRTCTCTVDNNTFTSATRNKENESDNMNRENGENGIFVSDDINDNTRSRSYNNCDSTLSSSPLSLSLPTRKPTMLHHRLDLPQAKSDLDSNSYIQQQLRLNSKLSLANDLMNFNDNVNVTDSYSTKDETTCTTQSQLKVTHREIIKSNPTRIIRSRVLVEKLSESGQKENIPTSKRGASCIANVYYSGFVCQYKNLRRRIPNDYNGNGYDHDDNDYDDDDDHNNIQEVQALAQAQALVRSRKEQWKNDSFYRNVSLYFTAFELKLLFLYEYESKKRTYTYLKMK